MVTGTTAVPAKRTTRPYAPGPAAVRPLGLGPLEWLFLAVITAILAVQLLVPPIVGVADNGDYGRILEPLGLEPVPQDWGDRYFLYVNREYRSVASKPALLLSSEHVLAAVARAADGLITRDGRTGLLSLGILQLALYLAGLFLVLSTARTFSLGARIALGAGLPVIATDVAWVSFFNSYYTESASLVFLAVLAGVLLRAVRGPEAGPEAGRWWLAAYTAAALLFLAAKPQNYVLAPILAALPPILTWSRRRSRIPAVIAAAVVLAGTGFLYGRVNRSFRLPILYNTVFYTILPLSPVPEHDLRDLGLEPELAGHSGTAAWDSRAPDFLDIAARYDYGDIGRFYLRHPGRLLAICRACSHEGAFIWREPLLGNFTKDSGRPARTLSRTFSGWSDFENRVFPKSFWFVAGFLGVVAALALREVLRRGPAGREGGTALVVLAFALMSGAEFLMSVAVEGLKDLVKHLYLFQVLFDACVLASVVYGADRLGRVLPWGFWRSASVPGGE